MQEPAVLETDLDRLSVLAQLVDQVPRRAADLDVRMLRTLEVLLACECVLLRAEETLHEMELPTHQLFVQVTGPNGETVRTLALRRPVHRPFAERELTLLELLRPRLVHWLTGSVLGRDGSPTDDLTTRQLEILRLAQLGMANKEIARSLRISADTVRKHLEHAYERLGAVSRTGAVAAAFGADSSRGG